MDEEAQQRDINPSYEGLAMVLSRRLGNIDDADKKVLEKSSTENNSNADGFRETAMTSKHESAKSPGTNTLEKLKPMITASPANTLNVQSFVVNFPPNALPSTLLEPPTAISLSKRTIAQRERREREREAKQVRTLKTYKRKGPTLLAQQSSQEFGRPKLSISTDTDAPVPLDVHPNILPMVSRVEPGTPEDVMPLRSISPMGTPIEQSSMINGCGQTSNAVKVICPSSLSPDIIFKRVKLLCCEGQVESLQHCKEKKEGDKSELLRLIIDPITPGVEAELSDAAKCFGGPHTELIKGNEAEIVAHGNDPTHAGSYPEKRIPFVKTSFLWKSLESMETFQQIPQNPCFRQLETHNEWTREGIAISLMVNFDNLVRNVRRLCISNSLSTFKEMLESLTTFEENGFDVRRIQSRIEELVEIKDFQRQVKNKMTTLKEQLSGNAYEDSQLDTQYCVLNKAIMKMERKLASLRKERDSLHKQKLAIRFKTANLQKDVQTAEEECLSAKRRFNGVVGSPW